MALSDFFHTCGVSTELQRQYYIFRQMGKSCLQKTLITLEDRRGHYCVYLLHPGTELART
eukprot:5874252-Amphidinium_carterae.1